MADPTIREQKLTQYLNDALLKERELETALTEHIKVTTRKPYKKRLQDHLKETKRQARDLERRIKKLNGTPGALSVPGGARAGKAAGAAATAAKKGAALAKGPLAALGGGESARMLKNAREEYFNEAEEIANYTLIEALANALSDKETAKLAKEHRREEERMQKFLGTLIPQLTKAVVTEEIPARERKPAAAKPAAAKPAAASRPRSSSRSSASSRSTAAKKAARTRTAAAKKRSAAASKAGKASAAKASGSAGRTTARRSTNNSGSASSSGSATRRRAAARTSSN